MITLASLKNTFKTSVLALSIASPTKEISNSQNVIELLHPNSSYVVIPSTPTIFIYNTDEIILATLPHTKNLLLDLTMPFYYRGGHEIQEGFYFGRYLIYDQRLIGIKLSCSTKITLIKEVQSYKKWPFRKSSNYRVPKIYLDFYRRNNFAQNSYNKEIKIGDFALSFKNVRISLVFESQLKSIQNLLNDSKQIGADIVSIVCDLPRQKMFENKLRPFNYYSITPLQNQLKQYARSSKKIVMYTGCKSAPMTQLYLANPFIVHHQLPQIRMEPHFLNKGGVIAALCSIQINAKDIVQDKPSVLKQIPNLNVNSYLREIRQSLPGKRLSFCPQNWSFYGSIPEQMEEILKKMHLWYIYWSINECQPFIVPLPLQNMTEIILKQFKQISKFLSKPLNSFISFYKLQSTCIVGEEEETSQVVIHQSLKDLIQQSKRPKYFIYTNNAQEINVLTKVIQEDSKIFICKKDIFMEEQIEKNRQIQNIQMRIADFAKKIIDMGLLSFKRIYKQNKSSFQPLSKDQLIVAINENLKTAIRSSYRAHPFYKLILELNRKQLQQTFGDVQIQVSSEEKSIFSIDVDRSKMPTSSYSGSQASNNYEKNPKHKQFFQTLESLKRIYSDQKRSSQVQCHRCLKYHLKQVVRQCELCRLKTCFLCFQSIKKQKATPQNFRQCVTCKKLCFCSLCMKKKKKMQKQKQKIQASSIEIQNLSIIHTQKSLEQLEQLKIRKDFQIETCQLCEIQGRTISYIKLSCAQCDNTKCFNCVKAKRGRGDRKFVLNWLCDKCKPPQIITSNQRQNMEMVDEGAQGERMQIQGQLSPIPEQVQLQNQMGRKSLQKNKNRRSPSNSASPRRDNRFKQDNQKNKPQPIKNNRKSPSNSRSPPRNRKALRSPSKSHSPPRKQNNNNKPQENKLRVRSPSQSHSPPRKQTNNNKPQQNKRKLRSPSQSHSPPRKQPNNRPQENKRRVQSPQQFHSPPAQKQQRKLRSPSKSVSPKRQHIENKKKNRSPSHSESPLMKRKNNQQNHQNQTKKQDNPNINNRSPSNSRSPRHKKQRLRSPSHSVSPKRQNNVHSDKKEQSRQRPRSPSNSGSNASKRKKRVQNSRSHSRSRSDHKNKSRQEGQIVASNSLWGKKADQNKFASNRDGRNNQDYKGRQNNQNWQDRPFQNRDRGRGQGGYNNRGGFRGRNQQNKNEDRGNYSNRKEYQDKNFGNSQRNHNQQPQQNQNDDLDAKILNIEQRPNQDIDY